MEDYIQYGYSRADEVSDVVDRIVGIINPSRVYLYSQKFDAAGKATGFKLCVVAECEDKTAVERDIYLEIDSEIPFDVIIYTPAEWNRLCEHPDSFARKIFLTGTVVYE